MRRILRLRNWHLHELLLFIFDLFALNFSYIVSLFLRYDFMYSTIPNQFLDNLKYVLILNSIFTIIIYNKFNLYRCLWRFAGVEEILRIFCAICLSFIIHIVITFFFFSDMSIVYYSLGFTLQFLLATFIRFSYKVYLTLCNNSYYKSSSYKHRIKNTMIIGAGCAGQLILSDIYKSNVDYCVKCFIDDDNNKWHRYIHSIPVVGGRDRIEQACQDFDIDIILLALPSAPLSEINAILNICQNTNCEMKKLPGIYQLLSGEVSVNKLKDIEIDDLLGREVIDVTNNEDFNYIIDKVVLVTGGGGSIGSELCRQITLHQPKELIIFDIYENNAYEIQQELIRKYPDLKMHVLIGSIRDINRVKEIFEKYRPDIVYHAAAHKHVPLMEDSPYEAIKNNVFGTLNVAICSLIFGIKRFVLISTDKAVNPTSIMGASKRICEMIIQSINYVSHQQDLSILKGILTIYSPKYLELLANKQKNGFETDLIAVRFGNVLGSNGSVIPVFKKQIKEGGPVTVTHPDIIRYFMTVSEAVSLVLKAGSLAKGGEIFVLDMGKPIKIDTLARNLIKLSGLKPDIDIKIIYTGLRPGEKLYEEKLMSEEGLSKTKNELIHIGQPIKFDATKLYCQLNQLYNLVSNNDQNIHFLIKQIVETYHSAESDLVNNQEKFNKLYMESK